MRSKDILLIAAAAWLVLRLTSAKAGTVAAAGYPVGMPSSNQNADMWLKTGALQLGSQLIREISRGGLASVLPAVTTGYAGGTLADGLGIDSFQLPSAAADVVDGIDWANVDVGGFW